MTPQYVEFITDPYIQIYLRSHYVKEELQTKL